MCQLMGLSASHPVQLSFSWERFTMRGSAAEGNPDGWGVAYFAGRDVQVLREPAPAAMSPLVEFLAVRGPPSETVVSHVRRASLGTRELANTQPFARTLGGRMHVFAHNGFIRYPSKLPRSPFLLPIGDTDSERVFCALLQRLEPLWRPPGVPPLSARKAIVAEFAEEFRSYGAMNFLYADGITLFAHGHRQTLPGDAISDEPGLFTLHKRPCNGDDAHDLCDGIVAEGECGAQTLVATVPLDGQPWQPLLSGDLRCFEGGFEA